MFRIRRIIDDVLPLDQKVVGQVQDILRERFPGLRPQEVDSLPEKLRNPLKYQFRSLLYVAERRGSVRGFALLLHEPELHFCFLDFLATRGQLSGTGTGGALYERVREEALALQAIGVFFECLPDDPDEGLPPDVLKANIARLRFYERYGARPLERNAYRMPTKPGEVGLPYLMFDDLVQKRPLRRDDIRKIVRAILERKYRHMCSPAYIDAVVQSFQDDPVPLRPPRYVKQRPAQTTHPLPARLTPIVLVVNDRHDIHHVRERGYVEAPVRIKAILQELEPSGLFWRIEPRDFSEAPIRAVHDSALVEYLRKACASVPQGKSLYPYVFPIRNATRPPQELTVLAGYYCIDTFTPLNPNAYLAAKRAVDCTLTAADAVLHGDRLAYALVRPPGHHAERRAFGGFCYFNNAAIAAHHLSRHGKVAVLDIDYHHGNGQQSIFYERDDVLTISLHGHPRFAYPYFTGFSNERGAGRGEGFNVNYALPEKIDAAMYRMVLSKALARIRRFGPRFLVVAFGLDPAKGDPTGTWPLTGADFEANGRLIGAARLPTLIVQEGGYRTRTLGTNARHFFEGLVRGAYAELGDWAARRYSGRAT